MTFGLSGISWLVRNLQRIFVSTSTSFWKPGCHDKLTSHLSFGLFGSRINLNNLGDFKTKDRKRWIPWKLNEHFHDPKNVKSGIEILRLKTGTFFWGWILYLSDPKQSKVGLKVTNRKELKESFGFSAMDEPTFLLMVQTFGEFSHLGWKRTM